MFIKLVRRLAEEMSLIRVHWTSKKFVQNAYEKTDRWQISKSGVYFSLRLLI